MEFSSNLLLAVIYLVIFLGAGVHSIKCYRCGINSPPEYYNDKNVTKRMCTHFDFSEKYVVDCPFSTMCMKQEFSLPIQNGVEIKGVIRDCAQQKKQYQYYSSGQWYPKEELITDAYPEGCVSMDDKGERIVKPRYCYCRKELCNSSPNTNHEGYTDIMGVIVVFNLMKYINSLR